jgi:response regulator RpfG family c-di-GMP phosphodiesterase
MARLKVLFADDQIPDDDIPDNDIISVMTKRYPHVDPDDIGHFLSMRDAVKVLRDGGYDVSTANTKRKALNLIKATHFDIAIVDLRWYFDMDVPDQDKENTGWDLCNAIEEADRRATSTPTFQIVCSSRFDKKPAIAMIAAQRSKLPVFKSYNEAGSQSLLASLNFIEKYMSSPHEVRLNEIKDYWKTTNNELNKAEKEESRWSAITFVFVVLSVSLILAGALAVLFGYAQVSTLTSISSLITSVVSILLFGLLKQMQQNTKNRQQNLDRNFQSTMEQLKETEPKR